MATRRYELLSDEGLEIVYSVTLQAAIEALVHLVPRESAPMGFAAPEEILDPLPTGTLATGKG